MGGEAHIKENEGDSKREDRNEVRKRHGEVIAAEVTGTLITGASRENEIA